MRTDPILGAAGNRGFSDLPRYLRDFSASRTESDLLREVGAWMGRKVFGGLAAALRANLKKLFATADGRRLLVRTLRAAQGHPKLLELADKRRH